MNYTKLFIFICGSVLCVGSVAAQTKIATSTPTLKASITPSKVLSTTPPATPTSEDKQIESFKENIANKVSQLRKNQKAVAGNVTSTGTNELKLKTLSDVNYTVKIDDSLTKFYQINGAQKKEIKLGDIKKATYVIVSGPESDKVVTANVIYVDMQVFAKSGKVTEVDSINSTLKISTSEKDNLTIDIPAKLKMNMLDSKTLEIDTITISKIKEGDTIHFIYSKTGTEKQTDRYDAMKILTIPQEYFQAKKS